MYSGSRVQSIIPGQIWGQEQEEAGHMYLQSGSRERRTEAQILLFLFSVQASIPRMSLACQLSCFRSGLVTLKYVSMVILNSVEVAGKFYLHYVSTRLGHQFIFSSQPVLGSVGLALALIVAFYWWSSLFCLDEQFQAIEKGW